MLIETNDKTASLVDAIYDAALAPELWQEVLTRIADATGSVGGIMYWISSSSRQILARSVGRLDPECNARYEAHHLQNPWSVYMMAKPAGPLVQSDEIISFETLKYLDFYADVLKPQRIAHNYMSALINDFETVVAFNIARTSANGPMDADERNTLQALLPHLQRASRLQRRAEFSNMLREASFNTLDLVATAIVIVDQGGRILFTNAAADRSARAGRLVLRDGRISALSPSIGARLKRLVHETIGGGPGGAMLLPPPTAAELPLSLLAVPLRGTIARDVVAGELSGACAVLFIRDPNEEVAPDDNSLADLFGLTPAEVRVAIALFKGEDFAMAADRLGVSVNTVKTHARRIFMKIGVKRHPEFIRHLADRTTAVTLP